MIWVFCAIALVLMAPVLLIMLLKPALWCADGKVWHRWLYMWPVVLIAFLLDVLIAHTTWAWWVGYPAVQEWTVSDTLERLYLDTGHALYEHIAALAHSINRVSPGHLKVLVLPA